MFIGTVFIRDFSSVFNTAPYITWLVTKTTIDWALEILKWKELICGWNHSVSIQMKAIEQYFHVVLFIVLYKVALTFKSVDETLVWDYLNKSYRAVLSCGIVYYAVQGKKGLTFKSVDENLVRNYSHKSLSISTLGPNLLKLLSILSLFFNSCSWMLVVTFWISRTNKSGLMHKRYQLHSSHLPFFSVKFK